MGVLVDFVESCQPAYYPGGVKGAGTVGATWRWQFTLTDTAGDPIDLSSGVTGSCAIYAEVGGATIDTLDFTLSDGAFTIELDEADTAVLTPGTYVWACSLDDGTDVAQLWEPSSSRFIIEPGA